MEPWAWWCTKGGRQKAGEAEPSVVANAAHNPAPGTRGRVAARLSGHADRGRSPGNRRPQVWDALLPTHQASCRFTHFSHFPCVTRQPLEINRYREGMRAVFPGPERHHFVCEVIIEGAAKNIMLTGNDRLNGNPGFGVPDDDGLSVTFFFKEDGIVIRHRRPLTPKASGRCMQSSNRAVESDETRSQC